MTDFDDDLVSTGRTNQVQRLATVSGACISLALVCGMTFWGYKLLVRDVNGVPVVQAMEGAFRIAPEDPGGTQAPYQGLSVNEVAAVGTAGGQVDEVTLAPPPVDLAEEDGPRGPEPDRAVEPAEPTPETDGETVMAGDETEVPAPGVEGAPDRDEDIAALDSEADIAALDTDTDGGILPVDAGDEAHIADEPRNDGAAAIDAAVAEALSGVDGIGPEAAEDDAAAAPSLRPSPRPAALRRASAAIADAEPDAIPASFSVPEVEVATLDTGARLVQLGAFSDEAGAREEWREISSRFGDAFAGKRRVIQEATSGGATFYRLRAEGFETLAEARNFCTTLMAGSADCIPVELR